MEMQHRMKILGLNPRRLAIDLEKKPGEGNGPAYDHVRKIFNGLEFPGPRLLEMLWQSSRVRSK